MKTIEYKGYEISKNEQLGLPKCMDYIYQWDGEPALFASSIKECKSKIDEL